MLYFFSCQRLYGDQLKKYSHAELSFWESISQCCMVRTLHCVCILRNMCQIFLQFVVQTIL